MLGEYARPVADALHDAVIDWGLNGAVPCGMPADGPLRRLAAHILACIAQGPGGLPVAASGA